MSGDSGQARQLWLGHASGSGGLWFLYDAEGREWMWWLLRLYWCVALSFPFASAPWPSDGPGLFRLLLGWQGKAAAVAGMLLVWRLLRWVAEAFVRDLQARGWRRTEAGLAYWGVAVFFLPFLFFFQSLGAGLRWQGWGYFQTFQICLLAAFMLMLELFAGLRRISEARDAAEEAAQRSRLEPHFLFNVLNSIQAQIPTDPSAAAQALGKVGQLMRSVLALAERPMVTLGEELAFVETYLGLQRLRLGHGLKVAMDVPEEAEPLRLPSLALHTLVENAIKHGAVTGPGRELRIWAKVEPRYDAFKTSSDLILGVENSVEKDESPAAAEGTGTGLTSLRARLQDPSDLRVAREGGWYRATLTWRQP